MDHCEKKYIVTSNPIQSKFHDKYYILFCDFILATTVYYELDVNYMKIEIKKH